MRPAPMLLAAALALCAGCAHVDADSNRSTASQADAAATEPAAADDANAIIAAAIANPARPDADRERDAREHPAQVLAFAGFKPGTTIADIFGGGGYYSELLSGVVGAQGRVLLVNNPPYDAYAKKGLEPRLANNRLPNVSYSLVPTTAMALGIDSLDGALIVMSYHDLYVADPEQNWPAIDAGQFIDQITTALKPGATLLIIDHAARDGSGKDDAQTLHRIDEAFAIADFKAHGLDLVGKLDVLRNPDDDHGKNVFDPAIKGKTDRFVHLYRKR